MISYLIARLFYTHIDFDSNYQKKCYKSNCIELRSRRIEYIHSAFETRDHSQYQMYHLKDIQSVKPKKPNISAEESFNN